MMSFSLGDRASSSISVFQLTSFLKRSLVAMVTVTSTIVLATESAKALTYSGNFGTGTTFSSPVGVAVDSSGNVFVADTGNDRIARFEATPVPFGFVPLWGLLPVRIRTVTNRLRNQKALALK